MPFRGFPCRLACGFPSIRMTCGGFRLSLPSVRAIVRHSFGLALVGFILPRLRLFPTLVGFPLSVRLACRFGAFSGLPVPLVCLSVACGACPCPSGFHFAPYGVFRAVRGLLSVRVRFWLFWAVFSVSGLFPCRAASVLLSMFRRKTACPVSSGACHSLHAVKVLFYHTSENCFISPAILSGVFAHFSSHLSK